MSWLDLPDGTLFGPANLPLGIFSDGASGSRRTGVRIGDQVLDLAAVTDDSVHATGTLNAFLARGRRAWDDLRARLSEWCAADRDPAQLADHLLMLDSVRLHLPVDVADYVDFYSSRQHAENVGRMFRPDGEPLPRNWLHLPIGYHGRAGTLVVSGTPVRRPNGQRRHGDGPPDFGPSERLDFEAEVAFVVGVGSELGQAVPGDDLAEHVFGVCLLNDWSARDIQSWETVPLGPFLGKSFQTSVSPWVVPLAALDAARVEPPPRAVPTLDYLTIGAAHGYDLALDVRLNGQTVSRPEFASMYWTAAHQLAHLTVNGASLRPGDVFASGTVSSAADFGCLLELTVNGTQPLRLADGSECAFLADGDELTITATAPGAGGTRIGFGEVTGRIVG